MIPSSPALAIIQSVPHILAYCLVFLQKLGKWDLHMESYVNRKELEKRIWGKSIASARTNGLISEEEANFLLDEYLKECMGKTYWKSQNFGNLFG